VRFLITGGCGFLGSNLANHILGLKEDLIIVDNMSRFGSDLNIEWLKKMGDFKFYKQDVREFDTISSIIDNEKPQVIFHLAGQVAMSSSIENPLLDFEVNAKGTLNILESVRRFSPDTIVFYSSTNKVYGELDYLNYIEEKTRYIAEGYELGFDESLKLDFNTPYGCSKGCADQYMLDYSRMFDLNTVVFRHSSIFGGRQYSTTDQGWIGWFCQKAYEIKNFKENKLFEIHGNGKQVRDILFSEDLISCYLNALNNIGKISGNVYNIGGGYENSYSLLELFEELEKNLDIEMSYKKLGFRKCDQKVFIADIRKAQNDFGFKISISKEEGLRRMYEWVEKINM